MIVVVSGLPRSGTSMMMQMLAAGGIECLTDDVRQPDSSNPGGYFEYEKVKDLRKHSAWLDAADGKAIKIITQLVPWLPPERDYRFVIMLRYLEEILASQRNMLERLGRRDDGVAHDVIRTIYRQHLNDTREWIMDHGFRALYVDYADAIQNTAAVVGKVASLLEMDLDVDSMCGVVDRALYRERAPSASS